MLHTSTWLPKPSRNWFLAVFSGKGLTVGRWCRALTPEELFGQFLGLGKAWRGLEGRIQANPSILVLNVDETPQLWTEENTRAGIPDGQIRQVG